MSPRSRRTSLEGRFKCRTQKRVFRWPYALWVCHWQSTVLERSCTSVWHTFCFPYTAGKAVRVMTKLYYRTWNISYQSQTLVAISFLYFFSSYNCFTVEDALIPSAWIFSPPHLMPHETNILIITDIKRNVCLAPCSVPRSVASFNHNIWLNTDNRLVKAWGGNQVEGGNRERWGTSVILLIIKIKKS